MQNDDHIVTCSICLRRGGTPWNVYDDIVYPDTFRCNGYVDGGLIYVGGEPVGAVFE